MIDGLPDLMRRVLEERTPVVVVSPHLDDAVLSCGALLSLLVEACPVQVVTVFTEAGDPPHTRAARSFLRQCGAGGAAQLFAQRRVEDVAVLHALAVRHRHLGEPDALFRRRAGVPRQVAAAVPELAHVYPTYRFDIARGRVARADRALRARVQARVVDLVREAGAGLVLAPLGVGRHVDHLICRSLAGSFGRRTVYYSDFPYDLAHPPDAAFVHRHRLTGWSWPHRGAVKRRSVHGYRTQVDALFPGGVVPERPETFYLPPAG